MRMMRLKGEKDQADVRSDAPEPAGANNNAGQLGIKQDCESE
jgi:hypothetical protein